MLVTIRPTLFGMNSRVASTQSSLSSVQVLPEASARSTPIVRVSACAIEAFESPYSRMIAVILSTISTCWAHLRSSSRRTSRSASV
jgi:hypothetical protein